MYLVIEMQKLSESSLAVPTPLYTTSNLNQAYSEFYRLCSVAAVSNVLQHTVILVRDDGYFYETKTFEHPASQE